VAHCARLALEAGARGITIHPRPDQRHIRDGDVHELADLLLEYPQAEFNIEGNPFHDFMRHIRAVRPAQCTLVPDEVDAATSNSGWKLSGEFRGNAQRLAPLIEEMRGLGCRVSLFMDADSPDLAVAKELGADRVELYTEPYAAAFLQGKRVLARSIEQFAKAAEAARRLGMQVNAGHDLNLHNLGPFLAGVGEVQEVSIGHALIADALEFGMAETVRRYLAACAVA